MAHICLYKYVFVTGRQYEYEWKCQFYFHRLKTFNILLEEFVEHVCLAECLVLWYISARNIVQVFSQTTEQFADDENLPNFCNSIWWLDRLVLSLVFEDDVTKEIYRVGEQKNCAAELTLLSV